MTTTIDTNPAANLTINDANTADVITVSDGPAENGFQTTQVSGTANGGFTYIFANKPVVTIDGGNKGDKLVFNNRDPAAGLQSLTVQNLGTGSTIDGSNPNANSPDIAAGTLSLQAAGNIGVSRKTVTGNCNCERMSDP